MTKVIEDISYRPVSQFGPMDNITTHIQFNIDYVFIGAPTKYDLDKLRQLIKNTLEKHLP